MSSVRENFKLEFFVAPRSQRLTTLAQTTIMSRSLPPELLDLIVDHLHDDPSTLLSCCTVSKSWVPWSRWHIFAHVKFDTSRFSLESWMGAFPDPLDSPAHYTRSLTILDLAIAAATSPDAGRWIRAFHKIDHLHVNTISLNEDDQVSFAPLHGLLPTVRSLHFDSTYLKSSEVFGLLHSFPLLEDFELNTYSCQGEADEWRAPLTSPKLTGSLKLHNVVGGMGDIARQLLDLPNGLNFTRMVLACIEEGDHKAAGDLVLECSGTLESLDVTNYVLGVSPSTVVPDQYLIATIRL